MAKPRTTLELTRRGGVVACLAAFASGAAWIGGDTNARLAAAMLVAPLVVDLALKQRWLHRVELRLAPRRTVAGAQFQETVTVVHRGRHPLREVLLAEPRTMRHEPPALLPALPPLRPVGVTLRERSLQRSLVHERVFVLDSQWPLGMFRTRAVVPVAAELVTEPARVPLRAAVVDAATGTDTSPHDRSALAGPEFHSLREHLPDEDARTVHALRSASVGALVRRVTVGRAPRTAGIVLDLRRPPGRSLGRGMRRFEWSLGACATLLHALRNRGADAQVLVLAASPANVHVRGPLQETELLTMLAAAAPSPPHALPAEVFAAVRGLEHCFWIPAGAWSQAPELAAMPRQVTLVEGELE